MLGRSLTALLLLSAPACSGRSESSSTRAVPAAEAGHPGLAGIVDELRGDPHGDLKGIIVLVDGGVVAEGYFNGHGPDALHDMRSAGKSITSLLVGIAIDRGLIGGVDQPLSKLLPRAPAFEGITLRDLLTMRSGLDADDTDPQSPGSEDRMDAAPDWLAFAGQLPRRRPAGQTYGYASVNAFLAGAVVERAAGTGLQELAAEHLFRPLGIRDFAWRRGPLGEGAGQGNLSLRLRDAAAIGQLVLDGGARGSTQVVSRGWIEQSLAPLVPIGDVDPYADHYGFMWYRKVHTVAGRPVTVHFASGNGGNKIYVIPDRRMVVAIFSSAYGRPHGQPRSQRILLRILAAGPG